MNQLCPSVNLRSGKGEAKYTRRVKNAAEKSKNWGRGEKEGASEPGLCNGNHMAGGCGSDAPRLQGEAAEQPDTFHETGGKHFLGLPLRHHSSHEEERNESGPRKGGESRGGGQSPEHRRGQEGLHRT